MSHTPVFVQIRLGEKEGLDMALRYFEDRNGRLGDIEYYQVASHPVDHS